MAAKRRIPDALARLAAAEDAFLRSEFLAPVLRGQGVQVRIAGVRCQLRVEPADFQGFGVFRPLSHAAARLDRPATMGQRRQYLALFPAVSLLLCARQGAAGDTWLALPANRSDARFEVDGLIPVLLAEDAELFDTARARFDGARFWFDEVDSRTDPGAAAYLREALGRMAPPRMLDRPALTAGQREAYAAVYGDRVRREEERKNREIEREREDARASGERRLREALEHAGATLRDYAERGDVYSVSYTVDGQRHTSVVRKTDLSVQTAGICLSGEDQKFDLHSLIGVLREGRGTGQINRTL
jgi:hypothetical protein